MLKGERQGRSGSDDGLHGTGATARNNDPVSSHVHQVEWTQC